MSPSPFRNRDSREKKRKLKENILEGKKISRREAISTAGKIAITAVITGVVAGVGGYLSLIHI